MDLVENGLSLSFRPVSCFYFFITFYCEIVDFPRPNTEPRDVGMMARRPPPVGRGLSHTLCFPVDTSTRAFRRAWSEPRFPAEGFEGSTVQLKGAPIQLRWRSARQQAGVEGDSLVKASPWTKDEVRVDPHLVGFGRNPSHPPKVRTPPPSKGHQGLRGVHPSMSMRGENPGLEEQGVGLRGGEAIPNREVTQPNRLEPNQASSSSSPPPDSPSTIENPKLQSCIAKFVG